MRYPTTKYDRLTHLILDDVEGTELTLKEIALKHRVSHSFVAGRLKEYGINHGRKSGAAMKPSLIDELLQLSERGASAEELALKYGVTVATIYRHRMLNGFRKPKVERAPTGYVHIKVRATAARKAQATASFFGMQTATFTSEAIEHYINHLKS